jgi:hypothetical protein
VCDAQPVGPPSPLVVLEPLVVEPDVAQQDLEPLPSPGPSRRLASWSRALVLNPREPALACLAGAARYYGLGRTYSLDSQWPFFQAEWLVE